VGHSVYVQSTVIFQQMCKLPAILFIQSVQCFILSYFPDTITFHRSKCSPNDFSFKGSDLFATVWESVRMLILHKKKNEIGHLIFARNIFHALSKADSKGVIKICTTFGTNFHKPRIKNFLKLKTPCILKILIISM
jgi:hypothetical protein